MNLIEEYKRQRAFWGATVALAHARTLQEWESLSEYVRLDIQPDDTWYDVSFVDTWEDVSESRRERIKKEILERANAEGVWGVVGQFLDAEGDWQEADSCWGFIGEDWKGSGYDYDIMDETLKKARQTAKLAQFREHYV